MIAFEILNNYPFTERSYSKGQLIFEEGGTSNFYYQIKNGEIKMFNLSPEGKEFVQGYFKDGQSFGEPPLLGNFNYPASAIATRDTVLYILPREKFLDLLKENPEAHLQLTANLCNRIHYKATIVKEVSVYPPEHRILTLLNFLKTESGKEDIYEVNLTRQQISELTGLRVETVIRAVKKLEQQKKLSIKDRKIYL
ncbi:cyclic nucleotide-binding domain-containing protein [Leptobacterium flavescens]|uniref:Cyclic nucleotide-binding domain-containing protein n=1 Tax=Leptobacterium flavescens TaxID=472055 RepID=A0A6P0UNJ8_9FLAO|nr:Crp/Fnr family transcriptional regulator [Leptobacterium flavescens]NER14030.1 cyclic nucleotide-binding domain-containing protein [Leptobacterium flavescens]